MKTPLCSYRIFRWRLPWILMERTSIWLFPGCTKFSNIARPQVNLSMIGEAMDKVKANSIYCRGSPLTTKAMYMSQTQATIGYKNWSQMERISHIEEGAAQKRASSTIHMELPQVMMTSWWWQIKPIIAFRCSPWMDNSSLPGEGLVLLMVSSPSQAGLSPFQMIMWMWWIQAIIAFKNFWWLNQLTHQ